MYDQEYLDYLRALLLSMNEYGIVAYIVSSDTANSRNTLMESRGYIKMSSPDTVEEYILPHAWFRTALNSQSQAHPAGLLRLQVSICLTMEKDWCLADPHFSMVSEEDDCKASEDSGRQVCNLLMCMFAYPLDERLPKARLCHYEVPRLFETPRF